MLTAEQTAAWIKKTAAVIEENREYLTQLDSAIGDADHGNNMHRGFQAALGKLPESGEPADILKAVSMALISKVGGAGGPLYGTMYQKAAMAVKGKDELSAEDVEALLQAGVDGVKMRGRAEQGEKTMLDALVPALEAFKQARAKGQELISCLEHAVAAAEEGKRSTIDLVATKGRASYLGERSQGHQDPGATSSHLILQTLLEAAQG